MKKDLEQDADYRLMELENLAEQWLTKYKKPEDKLIVIDVEKEVWKEQP